MSAPSSLVEPRAFASACDSLSGILSRTARLFASHHADATLPPSNGTWAHRVSRRELVAVGAVSLCRVGTALDVRCQGNWLQMPWPNARSIQAQVVQRQPVWDRAVRLFVGVAMGAQSKAGGSHDSERGVTTLIDRARPNPTRSKTRFVGGNRPVLIDVRPKACIDRLRFRAGLHCFILPVCSGEVQL